VTASTAEWYFFHVYIEAAPRGDRQCGNFIFTCGAMQKKTHNCVFMILLDGMETDQREARGHWSSFHRRESEQILRERRYIVGTLPISVEVSVFSFAPWCDGVEHIRP